MPSEERRTLPILGAERLRLVSPLEIERAPWRVLPDWHTEHRLDPGQAHAFALEETRVEQGRRGVDDLPGRERLGNDPA